MEHILLSLKYVSDVAIRTNIPKANQITRSLLYTNIALIVREIYQCFDGKVCQMSNDLAENQNRESIRTQHTIQTNNVNRPTFLEHSV